MAAEMFTLINRGKRSVVLDLKKPDDVAALKALVRDADVLVESFRPGVMDRLGCGYETLRVLNQRLVYAALTGYGQTGDRKSVVSGKSVEVRVDHGGRRISKKKKKT